MTWRGRELTEMNFIGQRIYRFAYNADGIRTEKDINGTKHIYTLNGSQILAEEWGSNLLVYLYDESGSPIGMQYRSSSYAEGVFDTYYFEKNLQGDIIAVYTAAGVKIGSYQYDAWGNCTESVASGITAMQRNIVRNFNPFRYRGYYYDVETSLYYLQSRYYDPAMGRFLNADGYVSTGTGLLGLNMYTYCINNPVNMMDSAGTWPKWIEDGAAWVNVNIIEPVAEVIVRVYTYTSDFGPKVIEDIQNFDKSNTDVATALASNYISYYNGKLVIRTPLSRSGSLGVLFMSMGANATDLKHEYGHTVQLDEMGLFNYITCVGIPSLFKWGSDEIYSGKGRGAYYNKPWELMADIYGGVEREYDRHLVVEAYDYNHYAKEIGFLVWRKIKW